MLYDDREGGEERTTTHDSVGRIATSDRLTGWPKTAGLSGRIHRNPHTEYDTLSRLERGALLRREGLYSSLITTWREQRDKGDI